MEAEPVTLRPGRGQSRVPLCQPAPAPGEPGTTGAPGQPGSMTCSEERWSVDRILIIDTHERHIMHQARAIPFKPSTILTK